VVSRGQLRSRGLGVGAIEHRIRTRRLLPIHHGVYALGHRGLGPRGHRWAAVLAGGPGAALSHRSAAAAWGLRRTDRARHEVTTSARGTAGARGVEVHRVRRFAAPDRTTLERLPITTPARTLVDLADVLDPRALDRALHEAEVLRLLDLEAIAEALDRANGRRGTAHLAALVAGRTTAPMIRRELEHRFLELIRAAGLEQPRTNTRIAGYEVDALWRQASLVAELDGRATHAAAKALESDRRRDADLLVAGFETVRFTWRQVTAEPGWVLATLRTLLARERPGY